MGLLKGEVLFNVSWVDLGRALCHRSNPWFLPFFFRSTNKREGKLGAQRASVGIHSIFFLVGGGGVCFRRIHAGIHTIVLPPTHPTFAYPKLKTQRVQCTMIHNSMHTKMAYTGNIQE